MLGLLGLLSSPSYLTGARSGRKSHNSGDTLQYIASDGQWPQVCALWTGDLTIKSYCLPPSPYAPHKLMFSSSSHQAKDLFWDRQLSFCEELIIMESLTNFITNLGVVWPAQTGLEQFIQMMGRFNKTIIHNGTTNTFTTTADRRKGQQQPCKEISSNMNILPPVRLY